MPVFWFQVFRAAQSNVRIRTQIQITESRAHACVIRDASGRCLVDSLAVSFLKLTRGLATQSSVDREL